MTPHRLTLIGVLLALSSLGGDAFANTLDTFDYSTRAPAPRPWAFSASSGSSNTNYIADDTTDAVHRNQLVMYYAGSGSSTLSRSDVPGSNSIYEIEFWDDGTRNYGMLFQVYDAAGHFISIGTNNNVANGRYYVRTDANSGNSGPNIPVRRNSAANRGNWHQFQLYVTDWGSFPLVDGVPLANFAYTNLTSVSSVQIMLNWSKPANEYYFDNFRVTSLLNSDLPWGTLMTPDGRLSNTYSGIDSLYWIGAGDLLNQLDDTNGAGYWATNNPKRADIVRFALLNNAWNPDGTLSDSGNVCDGDAQSYYDGGTEWCSEFARDMFQWTNGARDVRYCVTKIFGVCVHYTYLHDVGDVGDFTGLFKQYGGWVDHRYITPATAEPGDYMTVPGSSGAYGHSEVIVAVTADASEIFTVDGNLTLASGHHCVGLNRRPYFTNGVLNPDIDAIGKINTFF